MGLGLELLEGCRVYILNSCLRSVQSFLTFVLELQGFWVERVYKVFGCKVVCSRICLKTGGLGFTACAAAFWMASGWTDCRLG